MSVLDEKVSRSYKDTLLGASVVSGGKGPRGPQRCKKFNSEVLCWKTEEETQKDALNPGTQLLLSHGIRACHLFFSYKYGKQLMALFT